jgi:hypothetical protein
VYRIKKLKRGQNPTEGCRAIDIHIDMVDVFGPKEVNTMNVNKRESA